MKLAIKLNDTGYMDTPLSAKKYSCKRMFRKRSLFEQSKCSEYYISNYLSGFLLATGKAIVQSNAC